MFILPVHWPSIQSVSYNLIHWNGLQHPYHTTKGQVAWRKDKWVSLCFAKLVILYIQSFSLNIGEHDYSKKTDRAVAGGDAVSGKFLLISELS